MVCFSKPLLTTLALATTLNTLNTVNSYIPSLPLSRPSLTNPSQTKLNGAYDAYDFGDLTNVPKPNPISVKEDVLVKPKPNKVSKAKPVAQQPVYEQTEQVKPKQPKGRAAKKVNEVAAPVAVEPVKVRRVVGWGW